MTRPSLRIALAQLNLCVGDIRGNSQRIIDTARDSRDRLAADVVIFPELSITGYPPEDLLLRPSLHRRVEAALQEIAGQVQGIDIVLGYPEQLPQGLGNTCAVLRDGDIIARYHKQHLPNYAVFDEKRYFVAGHEACIVTIQGIRCALTICEDIWVAEPALQARDAGADVILNINASPYRTVKLQQREQLLRDRAVQSGLPVVYLNLVGGQDELVFDGASMVVAADGRLCWRGRSFAEQLQTIDLHAGTPVRIATPEPEPAPSATAGVYAALTLGVRDYIHKNGFHGAVLGLSGGIDSALTLAIAVDAIGAENVEVALMPSRYTADISVTDAAAEAGLLGVRQHVIPIEPICTAFDDGLAEAFSGITPGGSHDTTSENIQARVRGVLLMALSNKTGKLLLTTGNKSEMAVGYATLYGDMAGGFAPLKDVPKQLVYALANWRNQQTTGQTAVIPERVITRPPSAELAPDQKDSDSLPEYDILDAILQHYIEFDESPEQIIAAGFDPETVRRIITLVDRNEYKRRQSAPGVRISRRAFGRDRRYPITSAYQEFD